ncbi:MAG: hypothetical protein ACP5FK_08970 [bacterium]
MIILTLNIHQYEQNPFNLAAQGHISQAMIVLDGLNNQGIINHQQLLLWARLKEQFAQTDSACSIYHQLSSYQDATGFLSAGELVKWNSNLVFSTDTIYVIDSFYQNHYIRHVRIYLKSGQGIFILDYNPFFSYPEISGCSHQNLTPGNYFRQKIIVDINFNATLSRLNFISSEPGNFVDFRIQGWDVTFPEKIEFQDPRPVSYQLIQLSSFPEYHISSQHFKRVNEKMIGSGDVPDQYQSQWSGSHPWLVPSKFQSWKELADSIEQRINLENNHAGLSDDVDLNDLPRFYQYLQQQYIILEIPLYRTHYFCRSIEFCLNHSELTVLEIAKLIQAVLSPQNKVEILLASNQMPQTRYSPSPSVYFERVMVRVDDSIWINPQLNSPFNYLPGSFQNVPALNLFTGELEILPILSYKYSQCEIRNSLSLIFPEISVQTDISLTGDFYLNLLDNRQDENFILNDITIKHGLAHDIQIQEELRPDRGIISIKYKQPLIPYSEHYSMIKLYVPDIFLSSVKFYNTEQSYNVNTSFKISYTVSGNFKLINPYQQFHTEINENWYQFYLNSKTDRESSFVQAEFILSQTQIPIWRSDQIEQLNNILSGQIFTKTLMVTH